MKGKQSEAAALTGIEFIDTNETGVVAMEITDDKEKSFAATMNSSGISHVIGRCLDLAVDVRFQTATLVAGSETPPCQIVGNRVQLRPGRTDTECAVTLQIGLLELVVFLPLTEVLRSFVQLRSNLDELNDLAQKPH